MTEPVPNPVSKPDPSEMSRDLVAYCRENSRVCPLPQRWNSLWEMLPNRARTGSGWQPSLPLILGAWADTPALMKMLRLTEHVEWADQHGALDRVNRFLRALPENEWFHLDD